ncbi:MAG: T9SS type A sorting domain-containing protein [Flavobacteriia bacterium]|nr:T9SS type A sorting domain-containing protein [Flavobacteriia bacterium]OJX35219.1 MAG: hypothetical protein BGO87_10025 [Flavobacteriia bacterium 40-80]
MKAKGILLFFFLLLFSRCFSATSYKSTILINNDVEIVVDAYDVVTNCYSWGYHYGVKINVTSRSLTNQAYSITFNTYFHTLLGSGANVYGGAYTISNTNPNLSGISANNNGKQVNYPSAYSCENLKLSDIGLTSVKIDYWGTYGGNTTGNFQSALPVQLTKFTADPGVHSVKLSWTTASERANDYFTLERSVDGSHFEVIATVKGAGTSSTVNNYLYQDENLPSGAYYYRLRQTDFDGKSELFDIISTVVAAKTGDEVNIYPNPSSDGYFTIENAEIFSGEIIVYNALGQKILAQRLENVFSARIYLSSENGVYFVEILKDGTMEPVKKKVLLKS